MRSKENIQASIGRREVKSGSGSIPRMYPKVKVRVQDLDDQDADLSLSWNMMSSPGEYQADSPKCVIRVPTSLLPKQQLHPTQEPKVVDQKDRILEETDRPSTRAASVTRPRAVLSSPDNDEMFGSKNSKRVIQPSPLRNHSTVQQQLVEDKIIPSKDPAENPIENDQINGSKDNKRVIQPSPLQNHNIVKQRQVEHKIIPSQTTAETHIENGKRTGSKNSKRAVQPSPLRNHNMVQKRHIEHKSVPQQAANETPSSRCKPAYPVNNHTPSTASIKGKSKTAKDQSLTKVKQSGIVASSQKMHLKPHKASTA